MLLVLTLVAMACATVFESAHSAEQALHVYYRAWWFECLLGLIGLNVLAAMLARIPFTLRQTGFVLTHLSILLIFAGALMTAETGVDGQVVIVEGQSVDEVRLSGVPTLTLLNRNTQKRSVTELLGGAFKGFTSVADPAAPPATLDNLSVTIEEFLPDSTIVQQMIDDSPFPRPAIEVSLSATGQESSTWLFANRQTDASGLLVAFRVAQTEAELADMLEVKAPAPSESVGKVKLDYEGKTYEFAVEECTAAAKPLGESGKTVKVLRYLPHASVGAENKMTNLSNRPVNPAIEVELTGAEGSETRLAFAKFPDFASMHENQKIEGLKLVFVAAPDSGPSTPVEVLVGPGDTLHARFAPPGRDVTNRVLTAGEAVDTPWPGRKLNVVRYFKNARLDRGVVPMVPVRKNRTPAIKVLLSAGNDTNSMWLQKYRPNSATVEGTPFEMYFGDKLVPLGFEVRLDDFEVGFYPGTMRPRSFESRVTISDAKTGREMSRVISMNHPVTYKGFTLFQSSYKESKQQTLSILSVARDPGQKVVFAGYILLTAGMLWVLGLRIRDRQRTAALEDGGGVTSGGRIDLLGATERCTQGVGVGARQNVTVAGGSSTAGAILLALLLSGFAASSASAATLPSSLDLSDIRELPVQTDGRWPPLDTLARDVVEEVTGTQFYRGSDPVLVLLGMTFNPDQWRQEPLIRIGNASLRQELQLSAAKTTFSFAELAAHRRLIELRNQLANLPEGEKPDALLGKAGQIYGKLVTLQGAFAGDVIKAIPHATEPLGAWHAISHAGHDHGTELAGVDAAWGELRTAFLADDAAGFNGATQRLVAAIGALPAATTPDPAMIAMEMRYNTLNPYRAAWIAMVVGVVLAVVAIPMRNKWLDLAPLVAMVLGFSILSYGIWLRWEIAGHIPASNMFESLLFLSWGMGAFAILSYFAFKHRLVVLTASFMGAVALVLADLLPVDSYMRPTVPVLLDTIWMAVHVPIIMVSYSILALGVLIAHAQIVAMAVVPGQRKLVATLDSLHYLYIHIGSILLFVGIVTGSMWGASSWGRYWGWDPKEVWSLVALLGYLTILHVRIDQEKVPVWAYFLAGVMGIALFVIVIPPLMPLSFTAVITFVGAAVAMILFVMWQGNFATAVKSITCFWLVLMTYLGVNYVLGTGLHSYGFGTGAVAKNMLMVGCIDLALVVACCGVYMWRGGWGARGDGGGAAPSAG